MKVLIFLIVLGNFLLAFSYVLSKIIVSGSVSKKPVEPTPYTFYSGFFGIIFFFPALVLNIWLGFANLNFLPAYNGLAAGTIWILSLWPLYYVLTRNEASRVMTTYVAVVPLSTFILKYVFVGERLNNFQLIAVTLLVSGGILVSMRRYRNEGLSLKDTMLTIVAGTGIALGLVLLEITYGLQGFSTKWQNILSGFTWLTGGYFFASIVLYLWPGQKEKILNNNMGKRNWKLFFCEKGFGVSGSILIKIIISTVSVTFVNAFEGLKQFFVLILAGILSLFYPEVYKEELAGVVLWQKILATVFVFSGIFLLIYGR